MANPYKTIGNTAAAVVSILAIGTLCWWQRPVTPINAPRPQDEAEIMTAVLERHYAMGRQIVGYYNSVFNGTYTTNYTTNLVYASITFTGGPLGTNGYYFDEPPTGTYTVALSPGGIGTLNSGGAVSLDAGNPALFGYGYPIFWYDDAYPSGVVNPIDAAYGTPENPLVWGYYNYVVAMTNVVTTNTTPQYDVQTNSIGFFPNAPFRFASGIRAAFLGGNTSAKFIPWSVYRNYDINLQLWYIPGYGCLDYAPPQEQIEPDEDNCLGVNREVGWIIPEDAYMQTGDTSWFGTMVHTNIFGGPLNYWREWDPVMDWYYGSTWGAFADKWFSRSQFVWTNYVSKCDSTWRTTTNYATSFVTNRVVGGITNTVTNTTFSTTNYVETGNVNTYISDVTDGVVGECVSMMFSFERDSPEIIRVDASRRGEPNEPAGKYHPAFWSTNTYNDMARALSLLQWIKDYRQPTTYVSWTVRYTNGSLQELSSTTGFAVASPSVSDYYYVRPAPPVTTSSWAFGTTVLYDFTNTLPFAVDKVTFTPTSFSTNGVTPSSWGIAPGQIANIAAGASGSSGWWPCDPDTMRDYLIAWASANDGNQGTGPVLSASIPYDCYHVQFSAITNYLNHAPAR